MAKDDIHTTEDIGTWEYGSRIHWGAVIAGVFIALVSQLVLGLLGIAIGLSTFNPAQEQDMDLAGLGVGSGVWLLISAIISSLLGAWAASWWSNTPYRPNGILHGVLTWSLFMVLTVMTIGTGVGSLIGGTFNMLSSSMTGMGTRLTTAQEPGQVAASNIQDIQNRLTDLFMSQTGPAGERLANLNTSTAVKQEISERIARGDTEGAARVLSQNSGLNMTESRNLISDAQVETREVAQQVTNTAERLAWWSFLALLLSLAAAALGGALGSRSRHTRVVVS